MKFKKNKDYVSNLQRVRNNNVIKLRKVKRLTEKQFLQKLNYAKLYYVDNLRKFTIDDLKHRYGVKGILLQRLYDELKIFEDKNVEELFSNSKIEDNVVVKEISLEDRLRNIKNLIKLENLSSTEQTKIREGFVYLIKNDIWSDWVKVGMTIDYNLRLSTYNIYDPLNNFSYIDIKWTDDRINAEQHLLKVFSIHADCSKGEWFKISLDKAIVLMQTLRG